MNPYLNWSTTTTSPPSPQPMVFTPSRCTVTTPRSSGTALAAASSSLSTTSCTTASCTTTSSTSTSTMSPPEQEMATTSNNIKNAYKSSTTSATSSSTCTTCADAVTTKGYRRPRPVSASSDRRECLLDRIAVMRQQEATSAYKICDYFDSANRKNSSSSSSPTAAPSSSTTAPDASCRAKMVQWCTQVTDYCEFSRETVAVALSYVDRHLSIISRATTSSASHQQQLHHHHHHHFADEQRAPLHDRREHQLLCMTALHTAIKIREPLEMDTELVAELSRGTYTAADVAWMEQQLLQVLGWRLASPTSLDFCRHLVELVAATSNDTDRVAEAMVELCQLQTELASADYRFVPLNPSTVAVSSILNAIEALGEDVIVPTERLVMVETIRRVTKIDVSAKAIRVCRDELMKGLGAGVDVANVAAIDSNDASCSSSGGGTSKSKFSRRESIGSTEESPISVAAHRGCCA